ncbi:IucA/IucC family protein [Glycomyces tenuis]|uniref:IucA/IucC family protein n=1 Tax=Glycomyces tenuis TaxID=58116 RepID=UPI00040AC917|nr:IucA/IucC family protein [Glycomyces tenuis]
MNLTSKILAAAWRENLNGLRERPRPIPFTAHEGPFNQLTVTSAPELTPLEALEAILGSPAPAHLAAELASAETGHAIAAARGAERRRHLAALADRAGASSLAALLAGCAKDADGTARLLETLATDGHQLHPCARTRLGWGPSDFARFDVETPRPVPVRLLADPTGLLARSGGDFRDHAMLAGLDLPDPVVPVHPWQLEHRILPAHRDLFATGRLRLLDQTVLAWPTAAVRTVCGAGRPGHLKLALGIHITSTRRDISPATARLAPALTGALARLVGADERHAIAADQAGAWLPGSRDLTAIARAPLAEAAPPGTVVVPASALCTASPVTGASLAAEYAHWAGGAEAWIRSYASLVVPPVLRLASEAGIGLEAHLQNSLIAFAGPEPVRLITRDLGGVRLHPPALPFAIDLPPDSPVRAAGHGEVIAKVAYTLFQNQLAAIVQALARDCGLDAARFWADLADLVAGLDLPPGDRDRYLAERMPTKALLTMRLHPGTEVEAWVDNPLHRRAP